jgi:hypothetical protein
LLLSWPVLSCIIPSHPSSSRLISLVSHCLISFRLVSSHLCSPLFRFPRLRQVKEN